MSMKEKKIISGLIAAIAIMVILNIAGSITSSKKNSYEFDPDQEGSSYVESLQASSGSEQTTDDVENNTTEATTEDTTEATTTEAPTTEATTEAVTQATGANYDMNSSTGYMFPDSDSRVLTTDEINSLSKEQIKYAKNEIYARNHYIFKAGGAMESYFKNKDWYSGEYSDQDDVLYNKCNATERKNILNLKKYE